MSERKPPIRAPLRDLSKLPLAREFAARVTDALLKGEKIPELPSMLREEAYDEVPTKTKAITIWWTPAEYVVLRRKLLRAPVAMSLHKFIKMELGIIPAPRAPRKRVRS